MKVVKNSKGRSTIPVNGKKSKAIDSATKARINPWLRKKLPPAGEVLDCPEEPDSVVCDVVSSKAGKTYMFFLRRANECWR